jgi:hypothetical protein
LASNDFHLFGPLKNYLGGKHIADDEEVEMEVAETTVKNFCAAGFDALVKQWNMCIVGGGYVEK